MKLLTYAISQNLVKYQQNEMAVFWKDVLSLTCHAMLSNFATLH